MAIDQTVDAVQANAQYLAQGQAMVSVAQQIEQAVAGQLAVFGGMQQAVLDLSSAMQDLPKQLSGISVGLLSGSEVSSGFLDVTNQVVGSLADFGAASQQAKDFLVGMSNPYVAAGAAVAALAVAYAQGSQESAELTKAIALTGNAAGTTGSELQGMAVSIDETVGTQAKAAEALAALAGSGQVGAENLQQFATTAVLMERNVGVAIGETVRAFAQLGESPVEASRKLNEQHNYLTSAIYSQIKALDEQGLKSEAAALAQQSYDDAMAKVSKSMEGRLGFMERAWRGVADVAKEAWDLMLGVGRDDTASDKLSDARKRLEAAKQRGPKNDIPAVVESWNKGIANLEREIAVLEKQEQTAKLTAQAERDSVNARKDAVNAIDAVDQITKSTLSKQERLNKELEDYRENLKKIKADEPGNFRLKPEVIRATEEGIRRKYLGETVNSRAVAQSDDSDLISIQRKIDAEKEYIASLVKRGAAQEKIGEGAKLEASIQAELDTGNLSARARVQKEKELDAARELTKQNALRVAKEAEISTQSKAAEKLKEYVESANKAAEGSAKAAEAQEALNKAFGKTKTEVERGKLGELKEGRAKVADEGPPIPGRLEAMDKAIAQQERYVSSLVVADFQAIGAQADALLNTAKEQSALAEKDVQMTGLSAVERAKLLALRQVELKYAKELEKLDKLPEGAEKDEKRDKLNEAKRIEGETAVAKVVRDDWQKTADQINGSLTDAFMKSLESGKDFGKNLGNALKEQFKSLVLKPTISAIMSPISGELSALVSGGAGTGVSASGVATNGGGVGSLFNTGGSIYNALTSGISNSISTSFTKFATSSIGQRLGLSEVVPGALDPSGAGSFQLSSLGNSVGSGLNMVGSAVSGGLAGYGISSALSGGYSTGGNTVNAIAGIAGVIGGPLIGAIAGVIGGLVNRGFGRKLKDVGIEGTLGGDAGFVGSQYKFFKGGWFRSDKTDRSDLDVDTQTAIAKSFKAIQTQVGVFATVLGLNADKIATFTTQLKFSTNGLSEQEIQEKFAEALRAGSNELAQEILGGVKRTIPEVTRTIQQNAGGDNPGDSYLTVVETPASVTYEPSEFAKEGEEAIDTLERLATSFSTVNDVADALGYGMQQASLSAAAFASNVVEKFGGLEQFSQQMGSYLANYYSDEEQRDTLARRASQAFRNAGLDVSAEQIVDATRPQVRAFVEMVLEEFGADSTQYATAVQQANALAGIYEPLPSVLKPTTEAVKDFSDSARDLTATVDELTQKFEAGLASLKGDADNLAVASLRAKGDEAGAKRLERQQYLDGFVDEHGNKLDDGRLLQLATQYDANNATRRAIDVQNERNGLQDELNALTDDATQALTRQRDALDESNRALFDNIQAIKLQKTIASELPGVIDKFLSPAQRRQAQYDQVTADLNAAGIQVNAKQLMGLSRAQIGGAAMDIYNTPGVSDATRLAVVRAAGTLADLKNAEVDTAFAALERAVDAQRTVLNEAITALTSVFETARDAAKSLFGEVESAVQVQGDEGRAFISNALAVAQSTGYLPDAEEFSKAVSNATGALGQQTFSTQAEADYQRLVLANELKGLQDISGDQLDKAKDELDCLEKQLEAQRKQIDVLNGIDVSVQSVAGAINALQAAMNGGRAASTLGGSGLATYDQETGVGRNAAGTVFQRDDIRKAAGEALEAGADPRDIYDIIKGSGFTLAQAGVILGTAPGSLEDFAREMDWPVFHRGTRRVPHTGFALLQQGEAVLPAAYNPFTSGRGWNNSNDMLTAMEGVRAELIEVRRQNDALQRAALRTADAVNGRPEAPMLVESV